MSFTKNVSHIVSIQFVIITYLNNQFSDRLAKWKPHTIPVILSRLNIKIIYTYTYRKFLPKVTSAF